MKECSVGVNSMCKKACGRAEPCGKEEEPVWLGWEKRELKGAREL